jgi:polyisoprenoid-binding protein YceI
MSETRSSKAGRGRGVASLAAALAVLGLTMVASAASATWTIDPAHTEVNFAVKHFFTPVTGSFEDFEVELVYDPAKPQASSVAVKIPVASLTTGNAKRDEHLLSGDWFEAEKYPYIDFKSTSVRANGNGQLVARGPLTIKGVSREIELPIRLLGTQPIAEPMRAMLGGSKEVASFKASTSVERGDFGVGVGSWAATMVVGSAVDIDILVEAHDR